MMRELEHREAVALMRWARIKENEWPCLKWLHHIPNGGARNKVVAGKLKAEGVKPGVSDYFLPWPTRNYHGLCLELKAQGSTYPTGQQKVFLADMTDAGYAATWCRGWEAASQAITAYLEGCVLPVDFRDWKP